MAPGGVAGVLGAVGQIAVYVARVVKILDDARDVTDAERRAVVVELLGRQAQRLPGWETLDVDSRQRILDGWSLTGLWLSSTAAERPVQLVRRFLGRPGIAEVLDALAQVRGTPQA